MQPEQVVLGKYKVIRQLDQGGMSNLYLARQLDQDREVVIKALQPQLANTKNREHFRREIHIMSRFQHPNAVSYIDSSSSDPAGPILVMEFLRGIDLNLLLRRTGKFSPDRAGRILAQLCDVLQAIHELGIIHRDLKPGNLMILHPGTPQETVKLMDFGLAKMTSMLYISPEEVVDCSVPTAAGTPEYICPEQVRSGDMGPRGDLYSVGVILFEMLIGKRPFEHAGIRELLLAHLEETPPTFADLGLPDLVPVPLERVIRACLEKYPEDRPASAMDLVQEYEQALGKRINIRRSPATVSPAASNPTPAPASRQTRLPRLNGQSPTPRPMPASVPSSSGSSARSAAPDSSSMLSRSQGGARGGDNPPPPLRRRISRAWKRSCPRPWP